MPVKWKIFLGLNLVISLPSLVSAIVLFLDVLNTNSRYTLIVYAILFGLLMVALNGFLNIYTLQRFYPDRLIPAGTRALNVFSFTINILACLGLLILCIYGAIEEFGSSYDRSDQTGKWILTLLAFLWMAQVAVLIMQGQLSPSIRRYHHKKISSLIDSIGQ
jgi:hypothetical protein